METSTSVRPRGSVRVAVLVILTFAASSNAWAQVPEFRLVPIAQGANINSQTTCPGTVVGGNELRTAAGGCDVEFEIRIFGWGPEPRRLSAYQATIDANGSTNPGTGYTSGLAGSLSPKGGVGSLLGGFVRLKVCSGNGRFCDPVGIQAPDCAGGEGFCIDNDEFVLAPCIPLTAIAQVTADYEYGAASQSPGCGAIEGVSGNYVGTLVLTASNLAKGTFTINFEADINRTFMTDGSTVGIPGPGPNGIPLLTPGKLRIVTGRCCFGLGSANAGCEDDLAQWECNTRPGPRVFDSLNVCPDPPSPAGCFPCFVHSDCRDRICVGGPNSGAPCNSGAGCPNGTCLFDNFCTQDICTLVACENNPLYNPALYCCNPAVGPNGGLTPLDDGEPCTAGVCDAGTGSVTHVPATGSACDDGFGCTVNDTCVDGLCEGTDVNTIPCTLNTDCMAGVCNPGTGLCECSETMPLCVIFETDTSVSDKNCFDLGEVVNSSIQIGAGSEVVTGGQFLVQYDPACLQFVDIGPCAGDTLFTNIIALEHDAAAGKIFYAVTSDPGTMANEGTPGPYDMACITFIKIGDCAECEVCFLDENPRLTILTNDDGNRVPLASCGCSKTIRTGGGLTLDTPDGADVNADCDVATATVTWNTASAFDTCEGALDVECQSQHVGGLPIDHLTSNGGVFPQGQSFFVCTATNNCGETETNVWTVNVSDQQTLDVEVHLQPEMAAGPFSRAITFELYNDCVTDPVEECLVVDFQGPYNLKGHGTGTLKADKGNFLCITARDNLHTLRAVAPIECVGGRYAAIFKGDPLLGGNWLIGGNLDGKKAGATYGDINTINILDFGVFMAQLADGAAYPDGNTDCTTPFPHGDINADGAVDALDYAFILANYLKNSKGACCPAPPATGVEFNFLTEVSVKDLRAMGYGEIIVADLNKDGLINADDMAAYMQGAMPQPVNNVRGKTRGTR